MYEKIITLLKDALQKRETQYMYNLNLDFYDLDDNDCKYIVNYIQKQSRYYRCEFINHDIISVEKIIPVKRLILEWDVYTHSSAGYGEKYESWIYK